VICPKCGNATKRYPKYPDEYGNPTDGSYVTYCVKCEWEDDD